MIIAAGRPGADGDDAASGELVAGHAAGAEPAGGDGGLVSGGGPAEAHRIAARQVGAAQLGEDGRQGVGGGQAGGAGLGAGQADCGGVSVGAGPVGGDEGRVSDGHAGAGRMDAELVDGGDVSVGAGQVGVDGGQVNGGGQATGTDRMAARQAGAGTVPGGGEKVGAGWVGGDEGQVDGGGQAGGETSGGEWVDAGEGRGGGGEPQRVAPGVVATAYGPGGRWLLSQATSMLGLNDDVSGFDPSPHPLVKRLAHEYQGLRFPGTRLIFPRLLRNICEQKVTGKEAYRAYTAIVRYFGQRAPGPREDLLLPPDPQQVAKTQYYEFHPLGLERKRADTLRRAAFEMPRLERCGSSAELTRRLTSIPGIGVWTAAEVVRIVFGDPDAVSVGDYHMKNIVSWALAGEPRGTDERMLELLEPFRGHRGRVCLLLEAAGIGAPRYGPRMPIREFHTW